MCIVTSYTHHDQYLGTQAAPAMYLTVGKEAAGKSFHYAKFPFEAMDAVIGYWQYSQYKAICMEGA